MTDIDASLAFSGAIGYRVVSRVLRAAIGGLTLLKLPDDEFVALAGKASPTGSPTQGGSSRPDSRRERECLDYSVVMIRLNN